MCWARKSGRWWTSQWRLAVTRSCGTAAMVPGLRFPPESISIDSPREATTRRRRWCCWSKSSRLWRPTTRLIKYRPVWTVTTHRSFLCPKSHELTTRGYLNRTSCAKRRNFFLVDSSLMLCDSRLRRSWQVGTLVVY